MMDGYGSCCMCRYWRPVWKLSWGREERRSRQGGCAPQATSRPRTFVFGEGTCEERMMRPSSCPKIRRSVMERTRYLAGLRGGAALLAALLFVLPLPGQAADLTLGGTGADLETMRLLADAFENANPGTIVEVLPSLGSGGGVKAVLAGAIDLALTSRPLKDKERAAGARETAYATTLTVFITGQNNALTDLTSAGLIEIYGGTRTTWADGSLIRLVLRPTSESEAVLVMTRVPGLEDPYRQALARKGVIVTFTDHENIEKISRIEGSLGTGTLSAVLLAEGADLKALSLNGVAPTPAAVVEGSYSLTRQLFFVTGPDHGDLVARFTSFVRSAEGTAILERTAHLPPLASVESSQ